MADADFVVRNQQSVPVTTFDGDGNQFTVGPHDRLVLPHDRQEIMYNMYSTASGYEKVTIEPEMDKNKLSDKFLGNDQSQLEEW